MKYFIYIATGVLAIAFGVLLGVYLTNLNEIVYTVMLYCGFLLAHFLLRLVFSIFVNMIPHDSNVYSMDNDLYCASERQSKLLEKSKIKQIKEKIITYDRSIFDIDTHGILKVNYEMTKAEIIHGHCFILNFFLMFLLFVSHNPSIVWIYFLVITIMFGFLSDFFQFFTQRYNLRKLHRIYALKERKTK